jgi:hypothetical protein
MSFVVAQPEALTAAAGHLTHVGSVMAMHSTAMAAGTTGLLPAAADEVSALAATQFNAHAAMYQAAGAQAMAIHEEFVAMLGRSRYSYAVTDAANTTAAR